MSILGLLSVAVIGIIVVIFSFKANKNTVKLLIILCFFQNIYILLLSRWLTKTDYTMICLLKEVFVYLTIIISFLKKRKIDRTELYSIMAILILFAYMIIRMDFSMGALSSFRQLSVPFIFYMFGRSIRLNKGEFIEIIRCFVYICLLSVIFGLVQVLMGPALFQAFGMKNYMTLKYGFVQYINGFYVPSSMMSFDLYQYIGRCIYRMSSFLVDPVILAQILALALLLIFFDKNREITDKKNAKVWTVMMSVGLVLTMGKGGIVISVLCFVYFFGKKTKENKLLSLLAYALIAMVCIVLVINASSGSSISNHFEGLTDNIEVMKNYPLGKGIGTEGNLAAAYGQNVSDEVSGESFVGALMAQMGIVGLLIYGVFIYGLFLKYRKTYRVNNLYNVIFIATNCMWISSLVNNTAISFTNCFMYFVILGFAEKYIMLDYT
jgi:hypothetical protein